MHMQRELTVARTHLTMALGSARTGRRGSRVRCARIQRSRVQNHSSAHALTPNVSQLNSSVTCCKTLHDDQVMHIVCLYVHSLSPHVCGTNTDSSVAVAAQKMPTPTVATAATARCRLAGADSSSSSSLSYSSSACT